MKTRIWIYVQNNGDGSSSPFCFATEDQARKYAEQSMAAFGDEYGDDFEEALCYQDLEFDESGTLINPDVWESFDEPVIEKPKPVGGFIDKFKGI